MKIRQMSLTLQELTGCLSCLIQTKQVMEKRYSAKKYYLSKGIIKNYNVIINGINFYDQPVDSGIKRYEEIRKLTARGGEDYTTECFLDYENIKKLL